MVARVKLRRNDHVKANGNPDLPCHVISSGIKTENKVVSYNLKHYFSFPTINIIHNC